MAAAQRVEGQQGLAGWLAEPGRPGLEQEQGRAGQARPGHPSQPKGGAGFRAVQHMGREAGASWQAVCVQVVGMGFVTEEAVSKLAEMGFDKHDAWQVCVYVCARALL